MKTLRKSLVAASLIGLMGTTQYPSLRPSELNSFMNHTKTESKHKKNKRCKRKQRK